MSVQERQPYITVIIPVYNVYQYLEQCLESVVSQEYENLEIIAVDDGSTDGSGLTLDQYAASDSRFHVIHTENRGLSAARNIALDQAHGEYIAFLDSDDWMEPNAIEMLVRYALQYDADIVVSSAYKEWVNAKAPSQLVSDFAVYAGETACNELLYQKCFRYGVWGTLYRAKLFSIIRFPKGRVFEDIPITFRLFASSEKVIRVPDILYHYRMRKCSITHFHSLKNNSDLWYARYEIYVTWCDKGEIFRNRLIRDCMSAFRRIWFSYPEYLEQAEPSEQLRIEKLFHELHVFACSHMQEILRGNYPVQTKLLCVLALCDRPVYLKVLSRINTTRKVLKKEKPATETKLLFP